MNFCPECESILYICLEKDKHTEKNILFEKCKNCGYSHIKDLENESNSKLCVYSNTISNESLDTTNNLIDNKYIIKDPTLPRLDNIPCINPNCITKLYKNALIILNYKNLDIDKFSSKLNSLLKTEIKYNIKKIDDLELLDFNEIHLTNSIYYDYSSIKNNTVLLEFETNIEDNYSMFNEINLKKNVLFSDCLINNNMDDVIISPIKTQVLFIKYDTKNMKYMYICSTCSTSWKNVT